MQSLTITVIQADLYWEDKAANLTMFEQKINSIRERTEIVVLPEMFSTGFSMKAELLAETMEGETIQWMKRVASQNKIILTGSFICRGDNEGTVQAAPSTLRQAQGAQGSVPTRYYNRLVWMLPNGQYGIYDKRHLFAYAGEDEHYTAGTKRFITSVKGWKIHPLICYDLRFPVWARQNSLSARRGDGGETEPAYDVMIFVANWPEKRIQAWKTLLQARAIENQCYVVGVNRTGDDGAGIHYSGESMIVDPMGEVLYTKKEEEDIFTITLDKTNLQAVREKLPFLRDADSFKIMTDKE